MSRRPGGAFRVASGILLSRLMGLLRERTVAHYFGVGAFADVFATVFRGPNLIQNLLGEQSLSAAFIPIYSRKLAEGRPEEAGRFAGAIFGLLLASAALLALLGIILARPIVTLFAPGYLGDAAAVAAGERTVDRFVLAATAVRILFPMTGILVLASWCLGVLNSHRRFFLPYVAPVLWNAAIIAALVWFGGEALTPGDVAAGSRLLYAGCVGALVGGLLQFGVQLPLVLRLLRGFRPSLSTRIGGVREALRNFAPAVAGRGVVQISSYVDIVLASLLAVGAMAALGFAQRLYVLPVSLFGLSFAAAELPELSRVGADDASQPRLRQAFRQMAFLTVPTGVGYLLFGFLLVGALYRTGSFSRLANWLVYFVLCGYTLGLIATNASRLLQTAFYAEQDTRTPAKVAAWRVATSGLLGLILSFWWDRYSLAATLGVEVEERDLSLGACGLAVAGGLAAWVEFALLRRSLGGRLPGLRLPWGSLLRMVGLACAAAVPSVLLWVLLPEIHPALAAIVVVGIYALLYLGGAVLLKLPEADSLRQRLGPGKGGRP